MVEPAVHFSNALEREVKCSDNMLHCAVPVVKEGCVREGGKRGCGKGKRVTGWGIGGRGQEGGQRERRGIGPLSFQTD